MTQINNTKYFKVIAKCGHVGKMHYIPVAFAVKAENASEASQIARKFPRVKKQCWDAILSCEEVSKFVYKQIIKSNNENSYFNCKTRKQQNQFNDIADLIVENKKQCFHKRKIEPAQSMKYRRTKYELGGSLRWTFCIMED